MIRLETLRRFQIEGGEDGGAFKVPSPVDGKDLLVIASTGLGWDHVSVSCKNRAPNQRELDHIFRLFFAPGETAVQYFLPRDEHINIHEYCLHLWRPQIGGFPKPQRRMV